MGEAANEPHRQGGDSPTLERSERNRLRTGLSGRTQRRGELALCATDDRLGPPVMDHRPLGGPGGCNQDKRERREDAPKPLHAHETPEPALRFTGSGSYSRYMQALVTLRGGQQRGVIAVAAAALVVLTTATAVAADDVREKHICSHKGSADSRGFHSVVEQPERFVGLSEQGARKLAREDGYLSRIGCRDGKNLLGTLDSRANRINFGVHHGRVVGYSLG